MSLYFILDGHNPVPVPDVLSWASWFEHADRTVAKTVVHGCTVSTVFLGIDHSFTAGARPVLFETMVFAEDSVVDLSSERYATWDDAVAGHARIVADLNGGRL